MLYLVFLTIGVVLGFAPTAEKALIALEPISITALVASLLVPFAAFDRVKERWQKFFIQYSMVPLFGAYGTVLWLEYGMVGLIFTIMATATHFAYWLSSLHSRAYRAEAFRMTHSPEATVREVAKLFAEGRTEEADQIIRRVLVHQP